MSARLKILIILAAAILFIPISLASAQDIAKRPGEGDVQRVGAQWRYMHRYYGPGHVNPKECWEWDPIDNRWEWECE